MRSATAPGKAPPAQDHAPAFPVHQGIFQNRLWTRYFVHLPSGTLRLGGRIWRIIPEPERYRCQLKCRYSPLLAPGSQLCSLTAILPQEETLTMVVARVP